jgi:hypothetical protein
MDSLRNAIFFSPKMALSLLSFDYWSFNQELYKPDLASCSSERRHFISERSASNLLLESSLSASNRSLILS